MMDRQTRTLWGNLTGEPVLGPGQVSFRLGWYAFFPHSELYGAASPGVP